MKKILEKLGNPGDEKRYWVYLKGKHMNFYYQRHAAFSLYFLGIVGKFFCLEVWENLPDVVNTLIGSFIVLAIGYLIECIQLLNPKRNFDHLDAWVMWPPALLVGFAVDIVRFFCFH